MGLRFAKNVVVATMLTSLTFALTAPWAEVAEAKPKVHAKRSAAGVSKVQPSPLDRRFSVRGHQYHLIEQRTAGGFVARQILLSEDSMQIITARHADGRMNTWELYKPGISFRMRMPINGKFTFLDVEKNYKQGILLMKFQRTKKGDYALYSAKALPHVKLAKSDTNDFVVGCRATEIKLQELAATVNGILDTNAGDDQFKQTVLTQVMDSSCNSGAFAAEKNVIADAINKVAASDKDWTKLTTPKPTTKGSFLQCLRYYNLDTHASRISAAFAQYGIRDIPNKFPWTVKCQDIAGEAGDFTNPPPPDFPYITLGLPASELAAQSSSTKNTDPTQAYAETFFHEMLHYSLISDETTVKAIEHCCAQDADAPACRKVEDIVKVQERAQIIEGQVVKQVGDQYSVYRDQLRNDFGPGTDAAVDQFYTDAGRAYENQLAQPGCNADGKGTLSSACDAKFKTTLQGIIDNNFGDANNSKCVTAASVNMDKSKAQALCSKLKQASYATFAINAPGNPCMGNRKTTAWLDWWIPTALADTANDPAAAFDQALASVCKSPINLNPPGATDSATAPLSPLSPDNPVDAAAQRNSVPIAQQSDTFNGVGGNTTANPTGPTNSWGSSVTGPDIPTYSNVPSQRESQIAGELRRQSDSTSAVGPLANTIAGQVFPSAQAASGATISGGNVTAPTAASNLPTLAHIPDPVNQSVTRSIASASVYPTAGAAIGNSSLSSSYSTGSGASAASAGISRAAPTAAGAASSVARGGIGGHSYGGGYGSTSGISGAGGGLAGMGGGGSNAADAAAARKQKEADDRALHDLLKSLQRPYRRVKADLERGSVIEQLTRYMVQVIDADGRAIGAGFPKYLLIYDDSKDQLVLQKDATKGSSSK